MLDSALSLLPEKQDKKVAIHRDYRFPGKVVCNLGQLNQVFMNLLTNALQSIDGAGVIRVRTEPDGDEILITIKDSGQGIPPEVLPHIFEPFYSKKVMGRSGTGLGLAIVKRIVEAHNGTIDVDSRPGHGSTFSVFLPLSLS